MAMKGPAIIRVEEATKQCDVAISLLPVPVYCPELSVAEG
jgi:hypothetical protein